MTAFLTNKYEWARRLLPLDLSGERWRVLFSVKEIHRGELAEVSVTKIAEMTGLNRRTVTRHLKASEAEQLIAVEWSKGGRAPHRIRLLEPTATPVLLRQPDCRSRNDGTEVSYCDSLTVAATATPHACARITPSTLEDGPALQAGPVYSLDTSEIVEAAPDAPLRGAGAHVAIDAMKSATRLEPFPSDAADEADEPSLEERISNLEADIADLAEQGLPVPDRLTTFIDRGHEPDEAELEDLEALARQVIEDENERVERANAEIDAARAAVAARKAGGSEPIRIDLAAWEAVRAARPAPCGSARALLADQVRIVDFADRLVSEALKRPADERGRFWLAHMRRVTSALIDEGIPRNAATKAVTVIREAADNLVAGRLNTSTIEAASGKARQENCHVR